jgi:hypothetical protein
MGTCVARLALVTGRIVKQTVMDGKATGTKAADTKATDSTRKQTITLWQYEGKRLVAVIHPNQAERYNYDSKNALAI